MIKKSTSFRSNNGPMDYFQGPKVALEGRKIERIPQLSGSNVIQNLGKTLNKLEALYKCKQVCFMIFVVSH